MVPNDEDISTRLDEWELKLLMALLYAAVERERIEMKLRRRLAKSGSYDDQLKSLDEREEDYKRIRRLYKRLDKLYTQTIG